MKHRLSSISGFHWYLEIQVCSIYIQYRLVVGIVLHVYWNPFPSVSCFSTPSLCYFKKSSNHSSICSCQITNNLPIRSFIKFQIIHYYLGTLNCMTWLILIIVNNLHSLLNAFFHDFICFFIASFKTRFIRFIIFPFPFSMLHEDIHYNQSQFGNPSWLVLVPQSFIIFSLSVL